MGFILSAEIIQNQISYRIRLIWPPASFSQALSLVCHLQWHFRCIKFLVKILRFTKGLSLHLKKIGKCFENLPKKWCIFKRNCMKVMYEIRSKYLVFQTVRESICAGSSTQSVHYGTKNNSRTCSCLSSSCRGSYYAVARTAIKMNSTLFVGFCRKKSNWFKNYPMRIHFAQFAEDRFTPKNPLARWSEFSSRWLC